MLILSVESSCDETSVAVTDGRRVLSNVIATQIAEHRIYGGVVPEIASRRHAEAISQVCRRAVEQAGITYKEIEAVAVTFAPGLIGALLVGVNFAKGLAMALGVPLIPVHHLRGHIAANYITAPDLKPPFLCLLVSGGNTQIVLVEDYTVFRPIGITRDDAAGECFDKSARAMGLPYPGGVELDKIADPEGWKKYTLPRPSVHDGGYDFSFSGLKTAVVNLTHNAEQKGETVDVPALAGAVRHAVCDLLLSHTLGAAEEYGATQIVLAGGVSANSELRTRMQTACKENSYTLYMPELRYCGDNAAMIGVQAYYEQASGNFAGNDLNATATLPIDYRR
ncbi:MAG: tRNA (adenosine(37)-N6)-threonylcarbamoyltransferase complex transferase subunit TsaD [Clostridia bacterium]|nr:tRNA (adenosine(37)-N6)-threonylcarbamoyltransferase complex transferase subunit TsaD [Clostridia bacterium]